MARQLTEQDARESMREHAAAKGQAVRAAYGPLLGWDRLLELLEDRAFVRYPCQIVFDAAPLQSGEVAWPRPSGDSPEDGFTIFVHPGLEDRPNLVPAVVLYQLVVVNYGAFVAEEDAEAFGAAALGMSVDDYYQMLCVLADEVQG